MFEFDAIDFQRVAASAVGALVLTAASVMAAAGPARAAELQPVSVAEWQADVSQKIDRQVRRFDGMATGVATVRIAFDANGKVAATSLQKSTGSVMLDNAALNTARKIDYPVLPAQARSKPVLMKVYFGGEPKTVDQARRDAAARALALDANANMNIRPGA